MATYKPVEFDGFISCFFNCGKFAIIKIPPFINNPDLVERFKKDEPLSEDLKMDLFYMADEKGYTDYPVFGG